MNGLIPNMLYSPIYELVYAACLSMMISM